jgi:hypothetical protein
MIDSRKRQRFVGASATVVLAAGFTAAAWADDAKVKPASKDAQRASGVVVKVERAEGKRVLTVNTAAVWRDWVRDQAAESPRQSTGKDAREGNESVATKGEPRDSNALVKIEVADDSRIETRFRAADDETGKGKKASEVAGSDDGRRSTGKPTEFRSTDLKSGLFVEADYRRKDGCNVASALAVIRPLPPAASADKNGR